MRTLDVVRRHRADRSMNPDWTSLSWLQPSIAYRRNAPREDPQAHCTTSRCRAVGRGTARGGWRGTADALSKVVDHREEAPEQFTHRRTGPHSGKDIVVSSSQHGSTPQQQAQGAPPMAGRQAGAGRRTAPVQSPASRCLAIEMLTKSTTGELLDGVRRSSSGRHSPAANRGRRAVPANCVRGWLNRWG
jgi:hypothetical protein